MRFQVVALIVLSLCGGAASFEDDPCTTAADCSGSTYDECVSGKCKQCTSNSDCDDKWGDNCEDNTCKWKAGCECDKKCEDDFVGKLFGMSIGGFVLALIFTIVSSVPCCCGKDFDNKMCPKICGALSIILGILACFFPAMGAGAAADGAVEDFCSECDGGCTDKEKEAGKSVLSALGILIAYTHGLGFLAIIFGIISAAIGCCAICPCCGPLKTKYENEKRGAGGAVAGTVVGQAAP